MQEDTSVPALLYGVQEVREIASCLYMQQTFKYCNKTELALWLIQITFLLTSISDGKFFGFIDSL